MIVADAFYSRQQIALPEAWWIEAPSTEVLDLLHRHGVRFERLEAPRAVPVAAFEIAEYSRSGRPFQGHREARVEGQWTAAAKRTLPAGAVRIPARQPLGRVAAQLLEPQSEDSATTWNFFDAALEGAKTHPVLRQPR